MAEVGYDTEELKNEKVPTIYIELRDKRPSGFILNGTHGTKHEVQLDAPTARFIPNIVYRINCKEQTLNGKNLKTPMNEAIRWIKNETEISVEVQKERGIIPHRIGKEDKIIIEKGNFSVAREGAYIGLYDYLMDVFYNGTNKDRSDGADAIYNVIELGKEEEETNEMDFMIADAINFVRKLVQKIGEKKYKYDEDRINNLCQIFLVYAETMPGKVEALMQHAKYDPKNFIEKATKITQTKITEVAHALELSVIVFKGNTVMYANKDKVIATLGTGNMSQENKISKLADLFGTPEFKAAYEEFVLELEIAKEQALKNS
jgi:hypothetical protein